MTMIVLVLIMMVLMIMNVIVMEHLPGIDVHSFLYRSVFLCDYTLFLTLLYHGCDSGHEYNHEYECDYDEHLPCTCRCAGVLRFELLCCLVLLQAFITIVISWSWC